MSDALSQQFDDRAIKRALLDLLQDHGWNILATQNFDEHSRLSRADAFISHEAVLRGEPIGLDIVFNDGRNEPSSLRWPIPDSTDADLGYHLFVSVNPKELSERSWDTMRWQLYFKGEGLEFSANVAELADKLAEDAEFSFTVDQDTITGQNSTPKQILSKLKEDRILSELREDGWTIAPPTHGPDAGIDAEIFRDDLLLGRRFWLVAKVNRVKSGGKRSQVWQNICNQYGRDVLIVQPTRRAAPSAIPRTFEWLIVSREGQRRFTSSLAKLRERLNDQLRQRYAYAVTYAPNADGDSQPWTGEAKNGSTIVWILNARERPHEMRPGDAVVFLRQNYSESEPQNADLVGTGYMLSADPKRGNTPSDPFPIRVLQFFEHDPITYSELSKAVYSNLWSSPAGITRISDEDAQEIDTYLSLRERNGLFERLPKDEPSIVSAKAKATISISGSARAEVTTNEAEDVFLHDDGAERDHDSLNRATLALLFAWRLHEIWCQAQGLKEKSHLRPWRDADSFVAHIDAPWGGGKSTFANFICRVLNPHLDGPQAAPSFLKDLHPEQEDFSSAFIQSTFDPDGGSLPDEADARRPWIVVHYNAWLHEPVSPPWWCFYQVIRKSCFDAIRREGVPEVSTRRVDEDNLTTDDIFYTRQERAISKGWRWIRLWADELGWRVTNPDVRIQFFVALLSAFSVLALWSAGALAPVDGKPFFNSATGIGFIIAALIGVGSAIWTAAKLFYTALIPGHNPNGEQASLGPGDPFKRLREHFIATIERLKRPVLVVIDDIDRCNHETVVDLFRGIQTILQSRRVFYLVLGDRQWIERSFEASHPEMRTIDVGTEHTFGGRFVEKAIQLSYVLPGMSDEVRRRFLREMLLGKSATAGEMSAADEYRSKVRAEYSEADSVEEIEQKAEDLENQIDSPKDGQQQQIRGQERALRQASQRDAITEKTAHRLEPLAPYLPRNPREIKRIVNTIAMYHESLTVTDTENAADIGDERWRQLAIGVVLMMRFPQSWARLVTEAERLPAGNSYEEDNSEEDRRQFDLKDYPPEFVALMRSTEFREDGQPVKTVIDAEVVRWLHRLIPVAGLKAVDEGEQNAFDN